MKKAIDTAASLDAIAERYPVVFSDIWGVLHDGVRPFLDSAAALERARALGCAVVLITNAPRQKAEIIAQMAAIGVPESAWDRVVTSGDVTRELIRTGPRRIFHLGPERDLTPV